MAVTLSPHKYTTHLASNGVILYISRKKACAALRKLSNESEQQIVKSNEDKKKMSSHPKTVQIREVFQDYQGEDILIAGPVVDLLRESPVWGRSNYSDLVTTQASDDPLHSSAQTSRARSANVSSEERERRLVEARRRQEVKKEQQRQKKEKQKLWQRERQRQRNLLATQLESQESRSSVGDDPYEGSGVIISNPPPRRLSGSPRWRGVGRSPSTSSPQRKGLGSMPPDALHSTQVSVSSNTGEKVVSTTAGNVDEPPDTSAVRRLEFDSTIDSTDPLNISSTVEKDNGVSSFWDVSICVASKSPADSTTPDVETRGPSHKTHDGSSSKVQEPKRRQWALREEEASSSEDVDEYIPAKQSRTGRRIKPVTRHLELSIINASMMKKKRGKKAGAAHETESLADNVGEASSVPGSVLSAQESDGESVTSSVSEAFSKSLNESVKPTSSQSDLSLAPTPTSQSRRNLNKGKVKSLPVPSLLSPGKGKAMKQRQARTPKRPKLLKAPTGAAKKPKKNKNVSSPPKLGEIGKTNLLPNAQDQHVASIPQLSSPSALDNNRVPATGLQTKFVGDEQGIREKGLTSDDVFQTAKQVSSEQDFSQRNYVVASSSETFLRISRGSTVDAFASQGIPQSNLSVPSVSSIPSPSHTWIMNNQPLSTTSNSIGFHYPQTTTTIHTQSSNNQHALHTSEPFLSTILNPGKAMPEIYKKYDIAAPAPFVVSMSTGPNLLAPVPLISSACSSYGVYTTVFTPSTWSPTTVTRLGQKPITSSTASSTASQGPVQLFPSCSSSNPISPAANHHQRLEAPNQQLNLPMHQSQLIQQQQPRIGSPQLSGQQMYVRHKHPQGQNWECMQQHGQQRQHYQEPPHQYRQPQQLQPPPPQYHHQQMSDLQQQKPNFEHLQQPKLASQQKQKQMSELQQHKPNFEHLQQQPQLASQQKQKQMSELQQHKPNFEHLQQQPQLASQQKQKTQLNNSQEMSRRAVEEMLLFMDTSRVPNSQMPHTKQTATGFSTSQSPLATQSFGSKSNVQAPQPPVAHQQESRVSLYQDNQKDRNLFDVFQSPLGKGQYPQGVPNLIGPFPTGGYSGPLWQPAPAHIQRPSLTLSEPLSQKQNPQMAHQSRSSFTSQRCPFAPVVNPSTFCPRCIPDPVHPGHSALIPTSGKMGNNQVANSSGPNRLNVPNNVPKLRSTLTRLLPKVTNPVMSIRPSKDSMQLSTQGELMKVQGISGTSGPTQQRFVTGQTVPGAVDNQVHAQAQSNVDKQRQMYQTSHQHSNFSVSKTEQYQPASARQPGHPMGVLQSQPPSQSEFTSSNIPAVKLSVQDKVMSAAVPESVASASLSQSSVIQSVPVTTHTGTKARSVYDAWLQSLSNKNKPAALRQAYPPEKQPLRAPSIMCLPVQAGLRSPVSKPVPPVRHQAGSAANKSPNERSIHLVSKPQLITTLQAPTAQTKQDRPYHQDMKPRGSSLLHALDLSGNSTRTALCHETKDVKQKSLLSETGLVQSRSQIPRSDTLASSCTTIGENPREGTRQDVMSASNMLSRRASIDQPPTRVQVKQELSTSGKEEASSNQNLSNAVVHGPGNCILTKRSLMLPPTLLSPESKSCSQHTGWKSPPPHTQAQCEIHSSESFRSSAGNTSDLAASLTAGSDSVSTAADGSRLSDHVRSKLGNYQQSTQPKPLQTDSSKSESSLSQVESAPVTTTVREPSLLQDSLPTSKQISASMNVRVKQEQHSSAGSDDFNLTIATSSLAGQCSTMTVSSLAGQCSTMTVSSLAGQCSTMTVSSLAGQCSTMTVSSLAGQCSTMTVSSLAGQCSTMTVSSLARQCSTMTVSSPGALHAGANSLSQESESQVSRDPSLRQPLSGRTPFTLSRIIIKQEHHESLTEGHYSAGRFSAHVRVPSERVPIIKQEIQPSTNNPELSSLASGVVNKPQQTVAISVHPSIPSHTGHSVGLGTDDTQSTPSPAVSASVTAVQSSSSAHTVGVLSRSRHHIKQEKISSSTTPAAHMATETCLAQSGEVSVAADTSVVTNNVSSLTDGETTTRSSDTMSGELAPTVPMYRVVVATPAVSDDYMPVNDGVAAVTAINAAVVNNTNTRVTPLLNNQEDVATTNTAARHIAKAAIVKCDPEPVNPAAPTITSRSTTTEPPMLHYQVVLASSETAKSVEMATIKSEPGAATRSAEGSTTKATPCSTDVQQSSCANDQTASASTETGCAVETAVVKSEPYPTTFTTTPRSAALQTPALNYEVVVVSSQTSTTAVVTTDAKSDHLSLPTCDAQDKSTAQESLVTNSEIATPSLVSASTNNNTRIECNSNTCKIPEVLAAKASESTTQETPTLGYRVVVANMEDTSVNNPESTIIKSEISISTCVIPSTAGINTPVSCATVVTVVTSTQIKAETDPVSSLVRHTFQAETNAMSSSQVQNPAVCKTSGIPQTTGETLLSAQITQEVEPQAVCEVSGLSVLQSGPHTTRGTLLSPQISQALPVSCQNEVRARLATIVSSPMSRPIMAPIIHPPRPPNLIVLQRNASPSAGTPNFVVVQGNSPLIPIQNPTFGIMPTYSIVPSNLVIQTTQAQLNITPNMLGISACSSSARESSATEKSPTSSAYTVTASIPGETDQSGEINQNSIAPAEVKKEVELELSLIEPIDLSQDSPEPLSDVNSVTISAVHDGTGTTAGVDDRAETVVVGEEAQSLAPNAVLTTATGSLVLEDSDKGMPSVASAPSAVIITPQSLQEDVKREDVPSACLSGQVIDLSDDEEVPLCSSEPAVQTQTSSLVPSFLESTPRVNTATSAQTVQIIEDNKEGVAVPVFHNLDNECIDLCDDDDDYYYEKSGGEGAADRQHISVPGGASHSSEAKGNDGHDSDDDVIMIEALSTVPGAITIHIDAEENGAEPKEEPAVSAMLPGSSTKTTGVVIREARAGEEDDVVSLASSDVSCHSNRTTKSKTDTPGNQILKRRSSMASSGSSVAKFQLGRKSGTDSIGSSHGHHIGMPAAESRVGRALADIGGWDHDRVAAWLAQHKLDKICPNLTNLDGAGLQRMAFEYWRDTTVFFQRIKKSLGITPFQAMVIGKGMSELTGEDEMDEEEQQ